MKSTYSLAHAATRVPIILIMCLSVYSKPNDVTASCGLSPISSNANSCGVLTHRFYQLIVVQNNYTQNLKLTDSSMCTVTSSLSLIVFN